jgi:type IV pilus assembly protein PilE
MDTIKITPKAFSLMEVLCTMAIIGILASIIYPSYTDQIQRSRRADGKTALLRTAQQLERYFTENNDYTNATLNILGLPNNSPEQFYIITIVTGATTYQVSATPIGPQALDPCGVLTLDNINQRGAAQGNCW